MTDKNSWSKGTKALVITTFGLGAFWLLYLLRSMVMALVMGALFAYLLSPIARIMTQRTRWSRPFAARVVFAGFLLIMMALPASLGKVTVDQFHILEGEFLNAITAFENWISQPIELFGYIFHPDTAVKNLDKVMRNSLASIPELSFNILSILTSNLLWGLIFIASFYHLLVDGSQTPTVAKRGYTWLGSVGFLAFAG